MDDRKFFDIALEEARKGFAVGGIPVCYRLLTCIA